MRRIFLFRLAFLNTFKRKFRAMLAVGGIALSAGVMVFLFGIGDGIKSLVTGEINKSGVADVVTVNQRNAGLIKLNQDKVSEIKSMSGVGALEQVVGTVSEITYHSINLNMPVYGVTPGYFDLAPATVTDGEALGEPRTASGSVVISQKVAEAFGASPKDMIGRQLDVRITIQSAYASTLTDATKTLKTQKYTVVAVIDRGKFPVAYVSLENLIQGGVDSVSQLKVQLTSPDKMATVRESIERIGLQTSSIQDSINQVNRIFDVIQQILLIFSVITLTIAIFSTFNIITLTLIEETPQIGFLRVMGMQKHDVGFLFIAQSIMLTSSGAVLGIISGALMGSIINGIARSLVRDGAFSGEVYIFIIPITQSIIMFMLSIVLGWVIGSMPAKRAVLISPLEELKT